MIYNYSLLAMSFLCSWLETYASSKEVMKQCLFITTCWFESSKTHKYSCYMAEEYECLKRRMAKERQIYICAYIYVYCICIYLCIYVIYTYVYIFACIYIYTLHTQYIISNMPIGFERYIARLYKNYKQYHRVWNSNKILFLQSIFLYRSY